MKIKLLGWFVEIDDTEYECLNFLLDIDDKLISSINIICDLSEALNIINNKNDEHTMKSMDIPDNVMKRLRSETFKEDI